MSAGDEDFTRRVWAGTGFNTCSSYLPEDKLFVKMSRTEYVTYIKASLKDMALRSAKEALAKWGGDQNKLTHIVFGTMTGSIHAPTMDIEVAIELKLPSTIKRLNVEGMGCLTGYRALGLANDIARADPSHVVLLIVCDIRSALGNQLSPYVKGSPIDKSNVIVSSLFRDSGASAIVTSAEQGQSVPGSPSDKPLYEILDHKSYMVPNTFDLVKYAERDDAVIHLYIAKELPEAIKKALPGRIHALLTPHGLTTADCSYSVHTGGPKVLNYVQEGLKTTKERMASSWYCMQKWGNLSGSSNLVVLDNWRKLPKEVASDPRRHVVCMSFGPGVGMELVLLRAVAPEVPVNE
jgi:alkylresorcinol/alkylpyrone synthase